VVQQGAFVSPNTVPPTGGGLAKATLVGQGDELDSVAVDGDDAEQHLPKHWSADAPRFVVEMRTIRRVGHADER
jgi:hypothetical protein